MANEKLGIFPFILGWLAFIPLIGIFFGLIAILWAILTKKQGSKKLIIISVIGVIFSVAIIIWFSISETARAIHDAPLIYESAPAPAEAPAPKYDSEPPRLFKPPSHVEPSDPWPRSKP